MPTNIPALLVLVALAAAVAAPFIVQPVAMFRAEVIVKIGDLRE